MAYDLNLYLKWPTLAMFAFSNACVCVVRLCDVCMVSERRPAASRYDIDFEQKESHSCGAGAHGSVTIVTSRIDGCLYVIKRSMRKLRTEYVSDKA